MMIKFAQSRLPNEDHFQHKTELKGLLERYPKICEQMGMLFDKFLTLYAEEDRALEYIAKSDYTKLIADKCSERKNMITGIFEHIDADTRHFNPEFRQEAVSLQNIKNTYKDMMRKGINAQTAATHNFLQEMNGKRASLEHLHLGDWVDALNSVNKDVSGLVSDRDAERTKQTVPHMDDVRPAIDKVTDALYDALDTFANISTSDPDLTACIGELNVLNKRYADALAQHEGRLAAAKKKKKTKDDEDTDEMPEGE